MKFQIKWKSLMDEEELKLDMISSSEDKASSIQSFRPSQIMTPSEIDRVLEEISSEFTWFEFNKSDFSMNEHGKEWNSLENKETVRIISLLLIILAI